MKLRLASTAARRQAGARLRGDSTSLVLSSAATSALGLVFWVAATRLYPVEAVGQATTAVNAATVLAGVANLSLGPLYERFLPAAGALRARLVGAGLVLSAVLSVVLGTVFLAVTSADGLVTSRAQALAFVAAVVVLAAFSLLDAVLIGAHRARWAALKNTAHAVAKLVAIVLVSCAGTGFTIVLGWIVPAAVAVVVIEVLLLTVLRRGGRQESHTLPAARELAGYAGVSFGWMIAQAVPGLVVPVLVLSIAGVDQAAYYNIGWTVVTASLLVTSLIAGPYVSAAARPGADLPGLTRSFIRVLALVCLLRGLGVAVAGPVALMFYGTEYAEAGTPLLVVMGVVHLLSGPGHLYGALARVHRRIGYPMVVQAVGSVVLVVLVARWLEPMGIMAVAWAYLVHDLLVLAAAIPPLVALLRVTLRERR
ncbi:lipopolysaccharide biosynthesis protein [Micromonospora sp. WMMA1923]|uniref:lipopolysaccharide biosynthesis protein n=1 Tax=Micromonospora sp. WMMA1923 TaxID=3404125 RepID=UPI003B95DC7E